MIARISGGFDTDFGGVRAAFSAGTIRGAGARGSERAATSSSAIAGFHIGGQTRHVRAEARVVLVLGDEIARTYAADHVATFALLIAGAVATDAIGAEEGRRAILNDIALQALRAGSATITTAIDVGFIAVLNPIGTRKARIRFRIAENATLAAIRVGIAFDAIAFAIARIPANRTGRALR